MDKFKKKGESTKLSARMKLQAASKRIKEAENIIQQLKEKYIEMVVSSRDHWIKRRRNLYEFSDWCAANLPFTDEERKIIFPSKESPPKILSKDEKKKLKRRWLIFRAKKQS